MPNGGFDLPPKGYSASSASRYSEYGRIRSVLPTGMKDSVEYLRAVAPAFDEAGFLRSVVVNADDAVIITSAAMPPAKLRIVYVNAAFTRLTGYSASRRKAWIYNRTMDR